MAATTATTTTTATATAMQPPDYIASFYDMGKAHAASDAVDHDDEEETGLGLDSGDDDDISVPTESDDEDGVRYMHYDVNEKKRRREAYDRKRERQLKRIERYKLWKRHIPALYNHVGTHVLDWPSLFVQWLPPFMLKDYFGLDPKADNQADATLHPLLLGSYTGKDSEKDSIMVARVWIPHDRNPEDAEGEIKYLNSIFATERDNVIASLVVDSQSVSPPSPKSRKQARVPKTRNQRQKMPAPDAALPKLAERSAASLWPYHRYDLKAQAILPKTGEVKRARYMPQCPGMIASTSMSGDIIIHDLDAHGKVAYSGPRKPTRKDRTNAKPKNEPFTTEVIPFEPCLRLKGHTKDGYGIRWSPFKDGTLLSGLDDHKTMIWNVASTRGKYAISTLECGNGHTGPVNDVAWHTTDPEIFASVSDDRQLLIWDHRNADQGPSYRVVAHSNMDINCVGFQTRSMTSSASSTSVYSSESALIATGSKDQTVKLWDMRKLSEELFKLEHGHNGEILQIGWHPSNPNILASSASDTTFCIWDVSKRNEKVIDEAEPPWLHFVHGGHTGRVFDFDWILNSSNKAESWTIASCALDNVVQIWAVANCFQV